MADSIVRDLWSRQFLSLLTPDEEAKRIAQRHFGREGLPYAYPGQKTPSPKR